MPCAIRVEFSAVSMKEHDAKIFPGTHPVVAIGFHRCRRPAAAAQRYARRAGGLLARCSALLPPGHRPGRFHRSGVLAAKSAQVEQGLRSGAEKPRAIKTAFRIRYSPLPGLVAA